MGPLEQSTDAALVLRARGGDELAFRRLLDRHKDLIGIAASRYFSAGLGRDDFRQEAMFGMHKAIRDYRSDRGSSFRSFAKLCIDRQVTTALKRATTGNNSVLNTSLPFSLPIHGQEEEGLALGDLLEDSALGPVESLLVAEELTELQIRVATRLSDLERAALRGHADGLSYEEISERTGGSVRSVDNALQRARRKLAEDAPSSRFEDELRVRRTIRPRADKVPFLPFRNWLRRRRRELGTWKAVAFSIDRSYQYTSTLGAKKCRRQEIGRRSVEEMLEADGSTTFEQLYTELEAVAA